MPGLSEPQTASLAKGHMSELYKEAGGVMEKSLRQLFIALFYMWPSGSGQLFKEL